MSTGLAYTYWTVLANDVPGISLWSGPSHGVCSGDRQGGRHTVLGWHRVLRSVSHGGSWDGNDCFNGLTVIKKKILLSGFQRLVPRRCIFFLELTWLLIFRCMSVLLSFHVILTENIQNKKVQGIITRDIAKIPVIPTPHVRLAPTTGHVSQFFTTICKISKQK